MGQARVVICARDLRRDVWKETKERAEMR